VSTQNSNNDSLCPSFRYTEGSKLLGIRQENGKVSILPNPLEIDNKFLENLQENVPEQFFRFTNICQENSCQQWTKKGCGIALRVVNHLNKIDLNNILPDCSIRKDCRWHQQEGDRICKICPYIITDITTDDLKRYFKKDTHLEFKQ
jgi:hypothetical protein